MPDASGQTSRRIAVLGAGAWGTALAIALAGRHHVRLWARDPALADEMAIRRVNARYLPDAALPDGLMVTQDPAACLAEADLALAVTPFAGLRSVSRLLAGLAPDLPLLAACKGMEPDSGLLAHEVAQVGRSAHAPFAMLSGPSFAAEVARGQPTALTLACADAAFAARVARDLHSARLRIYSSTDVIGVEVGGAVKNVLAIAAGVSDGLGFGHNARAALITRGLAEVARLGVALGARSETLMGLSGAGDLILTCTGDLSRNRQVGLRLARGETLREILASLGHVAEGVQTAIGVRRLAARLNVDMPITAAVCSMIEDGLPAPEVVEMLLSRAPGSEVR